MLICGRRRRGSYLADLGRGRTIGQRLFWNRHRINGRAFGFHGIVLRPGVQRRDPGPVGLGPVRQTSRHHIERRHAHRHAGDGAKSRGAQELDYQDAHDILLA